MRALFVSSEVVPYSKTGGLADVAGALPAAIRASGPEVTTVTPRYSSIGTESLQARPDLAGEVRLGAHRIAWDAWHDPATDTVFVDVPSLFGRPSIYTNDPDEHLRFALLSVAALEIAALTGRRFDVIHCNDWQTGLIPALMLGPYREHRLLGGTPTVLTIHNLGYQGRFGAEVVPELGLDGHEHLLHAEHLGEGYVSMLETGLLHADRITTVSPTYAREIQTPEGGAGLDQLLRQRSADVVGILNGIDTDEWNPLTDTYLPVRFSIKSLWRKERAKKALLERLGLPYRQNVPVVGIITRLAAQKGIEIMSQPLEHFLRIWDLRLTVLGSGEPEYEAMFRSLAARFPEKVAFVPGYDIGLSHMIEAGADIFLMPSLYEPCGLNQMYSLAYGTIPVVRRVGGLADTVEQADPSFGTGTGVVFDHFTEDGLGWALGRALTLHLDRRGWQAIQRNGMSVDNSWGERARQYVDLYRSLITER